VLLNNYQVSINFHKSELFCYGEAQQMENHYTNLFECGLGQYPFRYLGIPMHHKKISNAKQKIIKEKFELLERKALGRLVLINSILTSLAMFMLSFYEVPKEVLYKLDFYRSRFFWQGDNHKKKYRLAKWGIICRPKDQGGLGVLNLELQNRSLLSKWLFSLINSEGHGKYSSRINTSAPKQLPK
jgi:hypothetical protein